ncbi:MAG: hypothetical protein ABI348_08360 [Nitrososphaera sp.]
MTIIALAVLASCLEPSFVRDADAASGPPPACNQSLWNHVYRPERLKVVNPCVSVTGAIESITPEPDGDLHILVKLDSQYSNLTKDNMANAIFQQGNLVVEAICQHETILSGPKAACSNFHQDLLLTIPPVGTHVEVVGSYVLDQGHFDWAEIHPVTAITPVNDTMRDAQPSSG